MQVRRVAEYPPKSLADGGAFVPKIARSCHGCDGGRTRWCLWDVGTLVVCSTYSRSEEGFLVKACRVDVTMVRDNCK